LSIIEENSLATRALFHLVNFFENFQLFYTPHVLSFSGLTRRKLESNKNTKAPSAALSHRLHREAAQTIDKL
jgi:hypothetical protein